MGCSSTSPAAAYCVIKSKSPDFHKLMLMTNTDVAGIRLSGTSVPAATHVECVQVWCGRRPMQRGRLDRCRFSTCRTNIPICMRCCLLQGCASKPSAASLKDN